MFFCVFLEPPIRSSSGLERKFAEFVLLLNKQLKPLGFELCRARLEDTEQHWYAVVNRTPDAAAKIGSKFSAQELEFFNKVVCIVIQSGILIKDPVHAAVAPQLLLDRLNTSEHQYCR